MDEVYSAPPPLSKTIFKPSEKSSVPKGKAMKTVIEGPVQNRTERTKVRVHAKKGNQGRGGDMGPDGELLGESIHSSTVDVYELEDRVIEREALKKRAKTDCPRSERVTSDSARGDLARAKAAHSGDDSLSTSSPERKKLKVSECSLDAKSVPCPSKSRVFLGMDIPPQMGRRETASEPSRVGNRAHEDDVEHRFLDGVEHDDDRSGNLLDHFVDTSDLGNNARQASCAMAVRKLSFDGVEEERVVASEDVGGGNVADDEGEEASMVRVIDLDAMLKEQEEDLSARRNALFERLEDMNSGRFRATLGRRRSTRGVAKKSGRLSAEERRFHRLQQRKEELKNKTPKELWHSMIRDQLCRCPDYFASSNALLQEKNCRAAKGKVVYPGLKVIVENCIDLNDLYMVRYRTKELLMGKAENASFDVFRSIIGQFMRWAISSGAMDRRDGWKPMALYQLMANESLVRIFVNYFIKTASFSTVAGKCNALRTLCKYATLKMMEGEDKNKVRRVEMMLNNTFNAAKSRAREQYRANQSADDRILNQTIVTKKHLELGIRTARAKLGDIIDEFNVTVGRESKKVAVEQLTSTKGLLEKWCLNFLGLIALTGGGQRPQAYARLQCPKRELLKSCWSIDMGKARGVFEMRTFREKTARALDVPNVNFPRFVLPYVAFHVEVVRPIVLRSRKMPVMKEFKRHRPLLLHSRTGLYMTTSHISRSIKTFMFGVDRSLTSVTAMTLRTSFATVMLHDYRNGKFEKNGKNMDEDKFLNLMAKQMNTSVEQLRTTYMSCYSEDFQEITALLTKHFCSILGEETDGEEDIEERFMNDSCPGSPLGSDGNSSDVEDDSGVDEGYFGLAILEKEEEEEEMGREGNKGDGCENEDEIEPIRRGRRRRSRN
ncbi:hypothetical protein FGB62_405g08 [Gracilaria domingensis]|nr:hypothetical protein FGB62_405g08 [Gracilaria domingensis]